MTTSQSFIGFRPTPGLRERVEQAAAANGQSMAQELRSRIERSFAHEEALEWAYQLVMSGRRVMFQPPVERGYRDP